MTAQLFAARASCGLGEVLAAATAGDDLAYRDTFSGMDAAWRDVLGHLILRLLADSCAWPAYGWASNHTPWSYLDGAGTKLVASIDAWALQRKAAAVERKAAKDQRRVRLSRLAFSLLRQGTDGRGIVERLTAENGRLSSPLPPAAVDNLAVWCAEQHAQQHHA